MSSAIITVREEFGFSVKYVRVARAADRNVHLAYERLVLLYHPRDVKPAGFYAVGRLVDFTPDFENHLFMRLAIADIREFSEVVSPLQYFKALRQRTHEDWSARRFAPGFRLISMADCKLVMQLGGLRREMDESANSIFTLGGNAWPEGLPHTASAQQLEERRTRDAQMRYQALAAYGSPACAATEFCTTDPDGIGVEVEICHIWPFGDNGPDIIGNVIPFMRTIHWCFDRGWFGLKRNGTIRMTSRAPEILVYTLRGRTKVRFPSLPEHWPRTECLEWHWNNKYRPTLELLNLPDEQFEE
jgi:hypothetical protein